MDNVPRGLAALKRAQRLQQRAARVGFDWTGPAEVLPKLREELAELTESMRKGGDRDCVAVEIGDLLFTCVNLARHLAVDADSALRRSTLKFERRFRRMEELAAARGSGISGFDPEALESLWDEAKESSSMREGPEVRRTRDEGRIPSSGEAGEA
jgi:ATP diphosphatase